ncbi:immunity 21 family protein [Sphingomonas sp. PL-96]|nr:immunity 21 family protein [Sphingomonas sp. PL-96]
MVGKQGVSDGVSFVRPLEILAADSVSPLPADKFEMLGEVDPEHPLDGMMVAQTLSLFGREDLIAASSYDYRANRCAAASAGSEVLDEIERWARRTSIVIINESHERSEHRGFSAELARRLRPLGYDALAMETLANPEPNVSAATLPAVLARPDQPFLEDEDGFYLSEAGFGRLGRVAKALGYRLVPYEEQEDASAGGTATREQRIATREETQARNLVRFLREHPNTRLLVHVGYSHATEVPLPDGGIWMAARLKAKTGIDPLTISQTSCRGGGDRVRLADLPADEPAGAFDLVVDHPTARFVRGRPAWRLAAGDRAVDIPASLRPVACGWRVIEARPVVEPDAAVPMDRVAIRPGETVALMLPPGRYRLRAIDVPAAKRAAPEQPR